MMTTQEIASRLVDLCRKGDFETAQKELYDSNALSTEPQATADFAKETRGLTAIIEKGHKFEELTEALHEMKVSEPVVAGNSFAVSMRMDITMKKTGRIDITELCVYQVKNGKVISEEFFM